MSQTFCPGLSSLTSTTSTSIVPLQRSPQSDHPPFIPGFAFLIHAHRFSHPCVAVTLCEPGCPQAPLAQPVSEPLCPSSLLCLLNQPPTSAIGHLPWALPAPRSPQPSRHRDLLGSPRSSPSGLSTAAALGQTCQLTLQGQHSLLSPPSL